MKAAQRAISILEKLDLKVKVLKMPDAKDPDEYIKLKGPDAFRNLIEASEHQIDYRLGQITAKYELSSDEQKVEFLKEASELVAKFPGSVERQVYAMRVAQMAGVDAKLVQDEVERRRRKLYSQARRTVNRENARPEQSIQPGERKLRYEDPSSAMAEEGLIRLLYLDGALAKGKELPKQEDFSSAALGHIYSAIAQRLSSGGSMSTAVLSESLTSDEMGLLVSVLQKPEDLKNGERSIRDYIEKIKQRNELKSDSTDLRALANKLRETKKYEG